MMRESFLEQVLSHATAWLLTYGIHSTVLLGGVWLVLRTKLVRSLTSQDVIWKTALLGALATATLHSALDLPRWSGTNESSVAVKAAPVRTAPSFEAPTRSALNSRTFEREPRPARQARPAVAARVDSRPLARQSELAQPTLPWALIALVGWVATASVALTRLLATRLRLRRHLGARRDVTEPELSTLLERLRREAGVRRRVRLSVSPLLSTPIAYGRSEICLPPRALTELTRRQQEAMLAHELAHLVRRDPAWRTITSLVQSVFFFQPLNAVAARRIQALAELLCDDWAVRRTGRRLVLAQCLAKVAGWIDEDRAAIPAPGMAQPGSNLVQRVQRLAAPTSNRPRVHARRTGFAAAALLLAVSCGMPTVSSSETQGFVARCLSLLQGTTTSVSSADTGADELGLQLVATSTTHFSNLRGGPDRRGQRTTAQGCEHCDHCQRNAQQERTARTRDEQIEQLSRELDALAQQLDRQAAELKHEQRGSRSRRPSSLYDGPYRPLPGGDAEHALQQGRMTEALEAYRRALPKMPRPLQEPHSQGKRPSPWPGEWKQPAGKWTKDTEDWAHQWAKEWEDFAEHSAADWEEWAEQWEAEWEEWAGKYAEEYEEQAEEWAEQYEDEWEEAFEEEREEYEERAEEWAEQFEDEWEEEHEEEWEEWAEQFEEAWEESGGSDAEAWQQWAEQQGAQWDVWVDEFQEQWDRNQGPEFEKRQQAWAEQWGHDYADRYQAWQEHYRRAYGGRNCDHDCKRRCRSGCTHPDEDEDDDDGEDTEADEGRGDAFVRDWPRATPRGLPRSLVNPPTLTLRLPARTLSLPVLAQNLPVPLDRFRSLTETRSPLYEPLDR